MIPLHSKRILLVQQGALGDFLMIWPVLASLRKALPTSALFWAGSPARLPLLSPLTIPYAPSVLLKSIRLLYLGDPNALHLAANDVVLWFTLRKKPTLIKHENLFFLRGMRQEGYRFPRSLFANDLLQLGIPFDDQWQTTFQSAFPRQEKQGRTILLFPGSGNPAKNWPLVQFFDLCTWLHHYRWNPVLVLGPVEQEKGLNIPKTRATVCPNTIPELISLLQQAAYVVGNDSGPMHLAGYMGIPGLSIFGPTSPEQWGPLGLHTLSLHLACSPCTQTARISCPDPVCIKKITLNQVTARIRPVLDTLMSAPAAVSPKNKAGS